MVQPNATHQPHQPHQRPRLVEVLDYGGGNLGSLTRALQRLGQPYKLVGGHANGEWPTGRYPVVLPGVGAFGAMMQALAERQLLASLNELNQQAVPLLGICVGLQVLFEGSDETPDVPGLGWLPGRVVKLPCHKVPQIGWNWLQPSGAHCDTWPAGHAYYVNSFVAPLATTPAHAVLYTSTYEGYSFCGAVQAGHLTAFQCHPEKSGPFGAGLLAHWLHQHAAWQPLALPLL
jgi:imidazole glycerol phosphate synthase glutamine amidotransferase subunit